MSNWQIDAKSILVSLRKFPASGPFLQPVDWKGLGLRDYPKIVKQPMDLETVGNKLAAGNVYSGMADFLADLSLIISNCKLYNAEGSEVFDLAVSVEAELQRLLKVGWKESAKKILNFLKKQASGEIFLDPVDWKGLGLNDYLKVVKNPMDMGTVTRKLGEDVYPDISAFFADLYLIWSNCMLYNADGSAVYEMAVTMKNETDRARMGAGHWFADPTGPGPITNYTIAPAVQHPAAVNSAVVPAVKKESASKRKSAMSSDDYDDKDVVKENNVAADQREDLIRLGRRLSLLQNDYLASAVRFIYAKCPSAVKQVGTDIGSIEIDIDVIGKDNSCNGSINQLIKVLLYLQMNPDEDVVMG